MKIVAEAVCVRSHSYCSLVGGFIGLDGFIKRPKSDPRQEMETD